MIKQAVYGLPLNPTHLLAELAGASFCISYATRQKLGKQLDDAIRLVGEDAILLVDNGAFTFWQKGTSARDESYIEGFEAWAQDILDRCPQAVAVIPDIIGGTVAENVELMNTTTLDRDRCMVIWHLDEPIDYFLRLCESWNYIGIGSCGDYENPATPEWRARMAEVFAALEAWENLDEGRLRPRIHMMRAQAQAHLFGFDSSDSTNVAVNHNRYRRSHPGEGHVARLAAQASAKIAASSGAEAKHQELRPLLGHVEAAAADARMLAELIAYKQELLEARFTVTVRELPEAA